MNKLKELLTTNIWTAVEDYFRHADSDDVYENISEQFVDRLASDSIISKQALRLLFGKSQGWNENLQAIVINGTKTHNPDYILVHNLANSILTPAKHDADWRKIDLIDRAISFFSRPNNQPDSYIDAINELAPYAYAPRKKRSRIFKALCDSLGVTDDSAGSDFQKLFAKFADELSTRKIDFKLFVSINPAHFLTMSNPKDDDRADFVRNAVKGINASLVGGTSDSLDTFFRAEDYDGTNGNFNRIINAEIEEDTVNVIYPANGGD